MDQRIATMRLDSGRKAPVLFWTFTVAGLALFASVTIPPGARRSSALRRDLDRAMAIHAGYQYKHTVLKQWERGLKTDPFFNEALLRAKMRYRKPGEIEVQVATRQASIIPAAMPRIPDFIPSPPLAASFRAQLMSWSILVMSALLLAAAFLFFDGPAHGRRA